MEQLLLFSGVAVAVVALSKLLERTGKEYTVLLLLAAVILAIGLALETVQPLLTFISELMQWGETEAEWTRILLKTLGICLLCQTTASVCRDAGENSLAFGVETLCRFTVVVQALPLLRQLADLVVQLLRG